MAVIVLDRSSQASMPCSEERARQLSERGRACVHRLMPFAIRDRRRADCIIQPMRIKLDPGCNVTGMAVVRAVDANGAAPRRHAVALFLVEPIHHGMRIRPNLSVRRRHAPTAPQLQAPLSRRSLRQSAPARRLAGAPPGAPHRHDNGLGARTKYNRRRLDLPKTRAIDALCMGAVVSIQHWQVPVQPIKCVARDSAPSASRTRPHAQQAGEGLRDGRPSSRRGT